MAPKRKKSADYQDFSSNKRSCILQKSTFDWSSLCFICGEAENLKKNYKHSIASKNNSDNIKQKILFSANIRNDKDIKNLLDGAVDLYDKGARYHAICYQNYKNEYAIQSFLNRNKETSVSIPFEKIAHDTVLFYKEKFEVGQFFFLSEICKKFRNTLVESGFKTAEEALNVKSGFIKLKLQEVTEYKLNFYSYPGKPDIVCSSKFSILYLFHKLIDSTLNSTEKLYDQDKNLIDDNVILHQAARTLRKDINEIPHTETLWLANEVSIKHSKSFVPESLKKLICWIIDEELFNQCLVVSDVKKYETLLRRTLSISECLIYCSRRKGNNTIIPPFHFGLTLQLHHMFGKKSLIDILNTYGFCCSNDDLRCFLTLAAEKELEKSKNVYIPSGLISKENGGQFIQEGDDNVDINTQTLDGKNTYHAMARVIFQVQNKRVCIETEKIPRNRAKRSLDNHYKSSFEVLFYQKPTMTPQPPAFTKPVAALKNNFKERVGDLYVRDLSWALLRNISRGIFSKGNLNKNEQIIPSWVSFNTHFADSTSTFTNVFYVPAINAKPSDLSTVYTTLKKGQQLMEACSQTYSVHTFDQQLYTIAQYVKFDRQHEFPNLVLRMGGFHTSCVFISCIGKIWGDAGVQDMLVSSNLYAVNTVDQMLNGKQFHRSVRGLTLCYEVLLHLLYINFFEWLAGKNDELLKNINKMYTEFYASYSDKKSSKDSLENLTKNLNTSFVTLLNEFRELKSSESPTFRFWDECLQALQLLLQFIRAQREGDWKLDLSSQAAMLPYFFACNKQNYARWCTFYVLEMLLKLPKQVENEFENGNFSINLTPGPFRGIWSDMAVEMSVIKDTKGDGGIIGLTRKDSTVLRWAVTRNVLGAYSAVMKTRSGYTNDMDLDYKHEGERKHEILKDEEHCNMILDYVKSHMQDPFSSSLQSDSIVNIGSGLIASQEIHAYLSNFRTKGQEKVLDFVSTRLDNSTQNRKGFYDPISQVAISTFSDSKKKLLLKLMDRH